MLRKLILKNREIPIPVPVVTLGDAIRWVEDDLLRKDAVLTSLILEDRELINERYRKSVKDMQLNASSRLRINIDTPKDLSSQSLDVVCDLSYGLTLRIRNLEPSLWKELNEYKKSEMQEFYADLELLKELMNHINALHEDSDLVYDSINRSYHSIDREKNRFELSLMHENCVDLVSSLQSLEVQLKELAKEVELLQIKILTGHLAFSSVG